MPTRWTPGRTIGSRRSRDRAVYSPAASSDHGEILISSPAVTRIEPRRPDLPDALVALASIGAFVTLLWLGRGLTFFADEWAVMAERSISLDSFLQPFNEHWLGVTTVVYRLMLGAFGLSSYMPYLALLAAMHVIVVLEVYVLARRAARPWLGALIALVVAFFGSGFENLFWAMQIGFVGAIALGLGAMILMDGQPGRGRVVAAVAQITIGMMTSGFGIFMFGLVGLDLLFDPRRRRLVPTLAVPAIIYLAWYLAFGRTGVATARDPFTIDAFLSVPAFVLDGVGTAVGSAIGVGPLVGRLAALVLVVVVVVRLVRGVPVSGRAVACFGAIVFEYADPWAPAGAIVRQRGRVHPLCLPVGDRRPARARQPGRADLAPRARSASVGDRHGARIGYHAGLDLECLAAARRPRALRRPCSPHPGGCHPREQ